MFAMFFSPKLFFSLNDETKVLRSATELARVSLFAFNSLSFAPSVLMFSFIVSRFAMYALKFALTSVSFARLSMIFLWFSSFSPSLLVSWSTSSIYLLAICWLSLWYSLSLTFSSSLNVNADFKSASLWFKSIV